MATVLKKPYMDETAQDTNAALREIRAAILNTEAKQEAIAEIQAEGARQVSLVESTGLDDVWTAIDNLGMSVTDNPEYLLAVTDAERHVLFGITKDGSVDWQKGIPAPVREIDEKLAKLGMSVTDNPEYLLAVTDAERHVLFGIAKDGSVDWQKGIPAPVREGQDVLTGRIDELGLSIQSNPEYLLAVTDAERHVLFGILPDGSLEFGNPELGLIRKDISDSVRCSQNPEYLHITEDRAGKLLEATRTDGVKEFHTPVELKGDVSISGGLAAHTIAYSEKNLSDLESVLKSRGFAAGTGDWSDSASLHIPMPDCAIVNIISADGWPDSKFVNYHAWMQFWDGSGNYFKKRIIFNAQGSSSMGFPKKNGAVDLCNDEWTGDDGFILKIGGWVPQDSFHLKAYYTDFFRGTGVVAYTLMNEIMSSRGLMADRPWKKALLNMNEIGTTAKNFDGLDSLPLQLDTGARCIPDGFPCIVCLNGEFYGIYSWQLKKHRDNMHMQKDVAEHVHLDGTINPSNLLDGDVDWQNQFEIRNPKNLYLQDGRKYDPDVGDYGELMGEDSPYYDVPSDSGKVKKRKETSAKVKKYITALSSIMPKLRAAKTAYNNAGQTPESLAALKALYERYFDVDNQIDYLIFSDITRNYDGFAKNWQWTTWDGVKWWINAYDLDGTFGGFWTGLQTIEPLTAHINENAYLPSHYVIYYYKEKLEARYAELRRVGILSSRHITDIMDSWCGRIGEDNFELEYRRWPDCNANGDTELNAQWKHIETDISLLSPYDETAEYAAGDTCLYRASTYMNYHAFQCVEACQGIPPVKVWRYRDSIYRFAKWVEESISNMDILYNYHT